MIRPDVSVVLPTLNGAATLPALLDALRRESRRTSLEIVAIDSGSDDGTRDLLRASGATVIDLGGMPFGHASARNQAASRAKGTALLFMTQDVEPVGDDWLQPLLEAVTVPGVAGAFGRQLPRGASPAEAFLAGVNYGAVPRSIRRESLGTPFGPGATYFSNAFGLMRRDVWEAIPFPLVVMSEDQAWALAALRAGHELRYVPQAAVHHGHRFSLTRAFRRNFDSGSSLQALGLAGASWSSRLEHLGAELRWIARRHSRVAAVHALMYEAVRMAAFQAGRLERVVPRMLARRLGEAPRP